MKIVISSGKGGTGKTFISTNIAKVLAESNEKITYLDCDVEEPNGHLFIKPENIKTEDVKILSPIAIDEKKCIKCGKCADACKYNAIAILNNKALFFKELCHICNACKIACPKDAIIESQRKIGILKIGTYQNINIIYGLLKTGEGGMSVRMIKKVKEKMSTGINIIDSAPGTSCPVVETVKDADICVLVTDPTPFGINDLKLAVDMCRELGQEPVVVINRAEYYNNDLKDYCKKAELQIVGEIPDERIIAEVYSNGGLVVDKLPKHKDTFKTLADNILKTAKEKRPAKKVAQKKFSPQNLTVQQEKPNISEGKSGKELVIISGKGGTGKTSITASFAVLAKNNVISDCDVDAADLHLVLNPGIIKRGTFSGGAIAKIDAHKCTGCGKCMEACQFDAIEVQKISGKSKYTIDPIACEGCAVCELVCKNNAVTLTAAINGEWYISDTKHGPMSHAKLGVAEENSGKLVGLVRQKALELSKEHSKTKIIMDGAPGTGCPVIASLTGVSYAIIVTEPTVSGLHDMIRIIDVIKHFRIKAGIIVNKFDLNNDMTENIKTSCKKSGLEFLGTIPYDKSITKAQIAGISIIEYTDNLATQSIKEIWGEIEIKNLF